MQIFERNQCQSVPASARAADLHFKTEDWERFEDEPMAFMVDEIIDSRADIENKYKSNDFQK